MFESSILEMSTSKVQGHNRLLRYFGAATLVVGLALTAAPMAGAKFAGSTSLPVRAPQVAMMHSPARMDAAHLLSLTPRVAAHSFHAVITIDSSFDASNSATLCANGHAKGSCTLRDAVARAVADAPHIDEIIVPKGRHITLSQGSLNITNSMVLDGTGAFINGAGALVFNISNSSAVRIAGFSVTGANGTSGGALYCITAAVSLVGVNFSHNTATSGGAVYSEKDCTTWISGSTFAANIAANYGGALYLLGNAVIDGSTIGGASSSSANQSPSGAGIYSSGNSTVVVNSTIKHNGSSSTYQYGAGIYNSETMDIVNSAVSYNLSGVGGEGAGIYNGGSLQMSNDFVNYNAISGAGKAYGAGLYDSGDATRLENVNFIGDSSLTTGYSVYGGAVYANSSSFLWNGGTVSQTVNGVSGQSDEVQGGAIYFNASQNEMTNVSIVGTNNNSLPNKYVYGGAVYVDSAAATSGLKIQGTTNAGAEIEGGVVYNGSYYASLVNTSVKDTKNTASYATGSDIYGGVLYNANDMTITNFSANNTIDIANLGSAPTPSSSTSYIEGGVFDNEEYLSASGVSLNGATVVANGGHGEISGGALYVNEPTILNNFQAVNFKVTSDYNVKGGLYDNNDHVAATNFTLGNSTIRVLGGVDAPSPYGQGSIIANNSNYPINMINATIVKVTTSVPASGGYNFGIDGYGYLTLTNATIFGDSMTGPSGAKTALLVAESGHNVSLTNSIVAASKPWQTCARVGTGAILSVGHNIDNGTTCHFFMPSDMQNTKALVLALANNGGTVLTAALTSPASPAINHGDNATCFPTDARGVARPQHGVCDIGAYEVK